MGATLAVALGGALGAVARHLVGREALRLFGAGFPWGTLVVNVAGSFVMGVLVGAMAHRFALSMEVRAFLTTGALGGFTTFSAFSLDAVTLMERGEMGLAGLYVAASVGVSIGALFAGLWLARGLFA